MVVARLAATVGGQPDGAKGTAGKEGGGGKAPCVTFRLPPPPPHHFLGFY